MAKALFGHVGGPDPRLVTEVQRLRRRVSDLEAEITRLQAANDDLAQAALEHETMVLDESQDRQPALT
ncbi:hypothetical protein EF847_08275 [Actinobacteria bacterium YIM 96077]|uniref:Uncharacterized protein n=1 Tax=Phytoactinopolyspora halophila TaxID=1981511 RepID=A0A329QDV5_9ACTN|nr:hypothetical protein EF847_08275 [Actinobacteria bacterium YIM 96077]RAW10633.1 hypothetical protein DPM12_18980 [Phytoactinopolyspora halophila]